MIQFVQKRDGRVVPFEKEKITKAIEKAGLAAHEFGRETAEYLTNIVVQEIIFEKEPINIEIIQNKIEEVLMRKGFYQTAKAFIIYREKRRELRELRKHLNIPELFDAYIGEETWEVHENANIDYSIQGLKAYITGKAEEIYWLEKVYPKKISDYHKDGFVHIHNLSFLGAYCVGWDLEDLIKRGFGGVPGKPYSSPAKHLSSILGQMMNFLFTLQNEAAGAVAFSSFDTLLAPFVYFDKLSYKEVKQQIQEFVYNMNQTMRTGGQSPFSNITVDLTPHPLLKDKPVIIGGKPIKEYTYGMFKKEMDLINKALFEVYIEGDGHGRPHSVSGESMCLIKENGRMKLVHIGDFINALMDQNKSVHIENDNSEIMDVRDRSIETVGIRDGRIIFQKVNYIARHPVNSLLKIITDGGFSIKVTESHSVFVLKNGKIEDYKASELKEGDYLITPRILPTHSSNEHKEISLAEEFIKKGKSDGIYIRDVKKKDGKRLWKKIYCKNSIGHISVFPLSSIKDELPELDLSEAKISLAGSNLKISNNLKISDELIELLGWYSAEGSAEKSKNYGGISLGLNLKKEKDKAIYISELIKKIWPNVPVKIREIEKRNLIEIRVHSKLIRRIFTEIFELKKGRERKIPDIIFERPNKQKKIFLNAYFQGDGYRSKDGLNITSISPQLIYGTSTLLKQLGIFHTISEYVNKGRKRFRINIWGDINFTDNHRSYTISKIPVKESGLLVLIDKLLEKEPFYYDSLGRKYSNTKERILRNLGISPEVDSTEIENIRKVVNYLKKNGIDIPETLIDILNDEMLFLKIKKIEQIETKNEMVYDFSTETENFIANNLLVHNTFPIPTLNVSKDFDWDNPVLEPVWEATAKYGTPYFCLEEKTKIVTKNGIKEIKDIEIGDEVLSDDGNFAKVTHVEKIVSKENIVIEGDNFNIICSPNHRFPTDNGIKRADELSLRDRLLLYKEKIILENGIVIDHRTRRFFELEDISSLTKKEFVKLTPKRIIKEIPPFKFNGNRWQTTLNNDIKIPEDLNEDIMELFGIVIGDGSIQEKSPSIRVVNADKEIIDFVTKTFEKEFNVKPDIRQAEHSKVCKEISVHSRIVVDFFKYYGISGSTRTKRIPEALFFRNEKEIGALLRGLFDTDGSIHINNNEQPIISISFSNEKLMKDTILLLAKIGIVGKFNRNEDNEKGRIVITGKRNIEMFKKKVGFRIKRKAEKLDYETKIDRPSIGDKILSKEEGAKFSEAYRHNPEYKDAKWVRIISDNEEPYLFIKKIEKGIEKVKINKISYDYTEHNLVDITVDSPNHLFVLENGIISHNSNYINSDLRPEDARSMCIDGNEEILIREEGIIKRLTLRDLVEGYKASKFDEDGWTEPKKHLEALSLNPNTMKMEWIPIKRFLKIKDSVGVKVTTDDGRTILFSQKHPMAVYTEKGIQMRFAKDVKKGDKFLLLNDANYTEDSKVNIVEVKQVELKTFIEPKEFYDIELTENHLFALANGLISFNCCRLRLETRELKSKGGGLFGANPLTGCYDEETEVLTKSGFKKFRDVTLNDEFYTRRSDGHVELHKPVRKFEYDWDGYLIRFKHKSLDLLVTPNHKMVVERRGKYKLVEAQDFDVNNDMIPKYSDWKGIEEEYFYLPPVEILKGIGPHSRFSRDEIEEIRITYANGESIYKLAEKYNCSPATITNVITKENYGQENRSKVIGETEPLKIKMDDWLAFFGIWLAEGSVDNENIAKDHGYRVFITQIKQDTREEIKHLLDKLPFNYSIDEKGFVITNKQLWNYLRQFGHAHDKFIPDEIKKLSKRQLSILFDWMLKGDGQIRKTTGQINYWTASKRLADDLQEIVMKLGWVATISTRKKKIAKIDGREIKSSIVYTVGVQQSKHYRLRKDDISLEYYKGKVYSVEVPNHTLFVRRNGKATWCGNSVGVITINMPRIGYLAKSEEEFFSILDDIMDAAKEGLEKKRETVEKFTEMGLYPYSRIYLDSIKESTGHYWSNHFSTIGLIGMNEALMNFFGTDVHMGTQKGIEFAVKVLEHMRNRLRKYQEETDHLFNLEATPAESTAYSLALKDKKLYPDIITAGTEENPYYTNSTQLPVGFTDDPFEVAALQEPVQKLYTGGCIEKGNKVLTDKGLLPIEYIVENFSHLKPIKALSYNKDKNISEWDEIVEAVKIDVSKENKIRVKGEKGLDIVTSDWHPFFVLEEIKPDTKCPVCGTKVNGIKGFAAHLRHNPTCREKYISMDKFRVVEKRADELKVGDYILQNSFNMYPDKESELDENLMWLIGFFIGDGSISKSIDNRGGNHLEKYYIRFSSESQRGLEKAASILNNYFGCFVNVIKNDKRSDTLREVTTSKKEVIDFFFKYGFWAGEKVYDIYVPEKVKENITQKNVYAFISGLIDSHGTIGKRDGDLEYDTVSERLANDILEIFTKAGILATKALKKTKRENEKDIFRIRVPQYELTRIKEKLGIEANLDRVKNALSDRVRRQLPVVRVKEISKVDVEDNEFYDLMTKNNHNYLAGKNCLVFVHNTVVHFFLGERLTNPNSAKIFVRKILENFEIPYITLTPSFSICPKHGYIPGEHEFCPYCDEELKEKARKGELENNKKSGKIDIDLKIDI